MIADHSGVVKSTEKPSKINGLAIITMLVVDDRPTQRTKRDT
jgi:hypothetical protein